MIGVAVGPDTIGLSKRNEVVFGMNTEQTGPGLLTAIGRGSVMENKTLKKALLSLLVICALFLGAILGIMIDRLALNPFSGTIRFESKDFNSLQIPEKQTAFVRKDILFYEPG